VEGDTGGFRIARRVAPDRIISTVDPEARHGHKTSARGFDGYKGHIAIDPDSEIITSMKVTAGNVGDGAVATELLDDCLPPADGAERKSAVPEQAEPVEVYGDRLTAPVPCSASSIAPVWWPWSRCKPRARRRAGSPRTGSSSTSPSGR
jgi:hypothetical protein